MLLVILQQNALRVGHCLREGLQALAQRHELLGDVRGSGLFVGAELVSDRENKTPASVEAVAVVNTMRQRGVLISATGPAGNILKIRPPLVFREEHAALFLDTLDTVLTEVAQR